MIGAAALLLLAAAVAAWFVALGARAAVRVQLRFAAILLASPALPAFVLQPAAGTILLLVLPIGLSVLALACTAGFARALAPALAAGLLGAVSLAALAAALTGLAALALAPAALAAAAIFAVCVRPFDAARPASLQGMLSALSFLAAQSAFALDGAGAAPLLFTAAGLLGITLALSRSDVVVEESAGRDLRRGAAIGGRGPA
ncbi:MAG TPA: hypothetical protein VNU97_14665 [Rhizomicrobium sp.]|jgi:hypothetical protein|nr:hypothetical protein [Rhizomicrobium sp.]